MQNEGGCCLPGHFSAACGEEEAGQRDGALISVPLASSVVLCDGYLQKGQLKSLTTKGTSIKEVLPNNLRCNALMCVFDKQLHMESL